jgi:hypothetical protein
MSRIYTMARFVEDLQRELELGKNQHLNNVPFIPT